MEDAFGGQSRLAFLPRSSITYHRSAYSRGGSCLPWIKDGLWYVGIYSSVAYFQALDSSVCYKQRSARYSGMFHTASALALVLLEEIE